VLEKGLTTKMLEGRVLAPRGTKLFVRYSFDIFQEAEPGHETNGTTGIDGFFLSINGNLLTGGYRLVAVYNMLKAMGILYNSRFE